MRFRSYQRLRTQADFAYARNEGRRQHCGVFLFIIRRRELSSGIRGPRLGVVASRRVGNAVTRNRLKRLAREIFRKHQLLFPVEVDVLIIYRSQAAELKYGELERRFLKAAARMGFRVEADE